MLRALVVVLQTAAAVPVAPSPSKCGGYADSVVAAASSSSDRAIDFARRLTRECRNDYEPLFRAGKALNAAARFDVADRNPLIREQADRLLGRAVVLRPRNAAAWLEYGTLLRKRGGVQRDAQRAIQRAIALSDQFPDSTPPDLLAQMLFQRGRYLQDWVDRLRFLKDASRVGVSTPACSESGAFCENYVHPALFNEQLRDAPVIDADFTNRREGMIEFYRRSVTLDPSRSEPAERYGRELALGGEWEQLRDLGKRVASAQSPGFFTAVEGLALSKLGRRGEADSVYRVAIPQLPDTMRRWFVEPPRGLDTIPDFWNRVRPLWVADVNEVQLEYWTRVAYAFLVLRDREAEVAGPETPMGDALLRYGWPAMITQVQRDAGRILSGAQLDAANTLGSCTPADAGGDPGACESSGAYTKDVSGGRWLFWTYAMDRPSMVFETRPGVTVARYMRDASAEEYATVLRETSPLTFRSQLAPKAFRLPIQIARFRGETPGQTAVAIYSVLPSKAMELPPADSVTVGLFVFRDTSGFPLELEQRTRHVPGEALLLGYRVSLAAGRYALSVEALNAAVGGAASVRDSVRAPVWQGDSLQLSDLLIAHRVEPRVADGTPTSWRDLTIGASRTLEVAKGASLWAVWETYGLQPGAQGTGRYQVTLALRDINARAAPLRLLERLGVGRRQGTAAVALEWAAERHLSSDGRALEYVAVELPQDIEGRYELVVTVTDPATGRSAKSSRILTIATPSP